MSSTWNKLPENPRNVVVLAIILFWLANSLNKQQLTMPGGNEIKSKAICIILHSARLLSIFTWKLCNNFSSFRYNCCLYKHVFMLIERRKLSFKLMQSGRFSINRKRQLLFKIIIMKSLKSQWLHSVIDESCSQSSCVQFMKRVALLMLFNFNSSISH